jgi:hypothetical protein
MIYDSIIGESCHTTSLTYIPTGICFISYEEIVNYFILVTIQSLDNNSEATNSILTDSYKYMLQSINEISLYILSLAISWKISTVSVHRIHFSDFCHSVFSILHYNLQDVTEIKAFR